MSTYKGYTIIPVDYQSEPLTGYPFFRLNDRIYFGTTEGFHRNLFEEAYKQFGLPEQLWNDRSFRTGIARGPDVVKEIENWIDVNGAYKQSSQPKGYEEETERINERKKTPEAQRPHKFQAAEWTHPNGHPRCKICGGEERIGGQCEGASKTSATPVIQNIVEVPTEKEMHGLGKAFILIDDGTLYKSTTDTSHGEIVNYLVDNMELSDGPGWASQEFWQWFDAHVLVSGRMGENSYVLYYSEHPNYTELLPEIKKEFSQMGLEEVDSMYRVAAPQYNFVYVPSQEPTNYMENSWRSLMIDTYTHTVYYSDPNKFHKAVIDGIEDLEGAGFAHSGDFYDDKRWVPGEYNITYRKAKAFGPGGEDVQPVVLDQIEMYFAGDDPELRITHVDNPWHILRKPFSFNESTFTLTIGKEGTGYLYDSSFTLDTYVPNVVKEALVKLTINQAETIWDEDLDEEAQGSYWTKQPNFNWWTSWVYIPESEKLIIKNQEQVNHTELLRDYDYWDMKDMTQAVYGIVTSDDSNENWQIVPYYSDAAMYGDEETPEFLDRDTASKDVDAAILAVRLWLGRVRGLDPRQITVHEAGVKTSMEVEQLDGWLIHSWLDVPVTESADYDWRWPMMVNVDTKNIYVGPRDSYHSFLLQLMGEEGDHGTPWASEHEGWFAGWVGNDKANFWDTDKGDDNDYMMTEEAEQVAYKWFKPKQLQMTSAYGATEETFGDYTIVSFAQDFSYDPSGGFNRWPVLIDIDEQKIFVGDKNWLHYNLIERLGDPDPDNGMWWVKRKNQLSGYEDWFAGVLSINENGPRVAIFNDNAPPNIRATLEQWLATQTQKTSAAPDYELVEMLVNSLQGNRGDAQALKDMLGPINTKWTQEEINDAVDAAYLIYLDKQEDARLQREKFDREMAEEEAKNPPDSELEVRWGYNRATHEWWIVPTESSIIHPDMMKVWKENWDWDADEIGIAQAWEKFAETFLFGYSMINMVSGRYQYMSEDSFDLYSPEHELTAEEQATLEKLVREFETKYNEGDYELELRKVASDDPAQIVDLGDWQDRGITWVYNWEDNVLAIAPWNRLHASVIKEVWGGRQPEDRVYGHMVAGTWAEPRTGQPMVVYGEEFSQRRKAVEELKRYVEDTLEPPKTSADNSHIEIIDTSGTRNHGMGWPFLYDELYDKLYFGNSESYHSELIKSMGEERMKDIWLRYYQEDSQSGYYDEDQTVSVIGGRYDPQNPYEPYTLYDFMEGEDKNRWRIKELVDQAMTMVPPIDYEAKVSMSPVNDYEYQWHDLTQYELAGYVNVPSEEQKQWKNRARRLNGRANLQGKSGRVYGKELWAIAQRFNNQCAYCGKPLTWGTPDATLDHVLPLALGGESLASNIVPSCLSCNQELNEWDTRNNPEIYAPADRVKYWLPEEFLDPNSQVPHLDTPQDPRYSTTVQTFESDSDSGHDAWIWDRSTDVLRYIYRGHHLELFQELAKADPAEVKEMMAAYGLDDSRFVMGDVELGFKNDQMQPVVGLFADVERPPEIDATVIKLWKERRPHLEKHLSTNVVEVDTTERHAEDIYDDSYRTPFIYVSTRDTIYIGSLNSHHTDVIFTVFDSDNPDEEQEMYNIEDDPGNLGVILKKGEILYWGEPKDEVIRAMQEKFPDYPQKMYDYPDDIRLSSFGDYPWVMDTDGQIYVGDNTREHHPELMYRLFPERFKSYVDWNDTDRDQAIFGNLTPSGRVDVYDYERPVVDIEALKIKVLQAAEEQGVPLGSEVLREQKKWE